MTNAMPSLQMRIKLSYGWRSLRPPVSPLQKKREDHMKNRKFRLKRKVIPFPALFLLLPAYIEFLYGDDGAFFGMLFMFSLFLVLWFFLGSDLDAPSSPGVRHGRLVDPAFLPPLDAGAAMQDVQLRLWSKRLYEERAFRGRLFAFALAGLLGATVLFALFSGRVLLRRANILIALCALGLLALAISALIRRLRRREERDRAAYPSPPPTAAFVPCSSAWSAWRTGKRAA